MTWKYASNQFAHATVGSFKKMLLLAGDHDARLEARKGEAPIAPLQDRFHPVYLTYAGAYTTWTSARGMREGGTATVTEMLDELASTRARQWDVKVMAVYDKGTPQHRGLFPDGREPLQLGPIDLRIEAVMSFYTRLTAHSETLPAELLSEVLDFHAELLSARQLQQGQHGSLAEASGELEAARLATAEMLYGNLGVLMDTYRATPERITQFFNLSLVRNTNGNGNGGDENDSDAEENTTTASGVA